jgi:hypothetical protein
MLYCVLDLLITAGSKPPFTDRYSCQLKVVGANLDYHRRFETSGDILLSPE